MDVFFEQLVPMPMKGMRLAAFLGTWIIGILLIVFAIGAGIFFPNALALSFLGACGVGYLTWRLAGQFRIEYEYSLTNGDFDIDRIMNQRKRDRVLSFRVSEIESIRPYRKGEQAPANATRKIFAAPSESATCAFLIRSEKQGLIYLVTAPDENIIKGLHQCLPRSFDTAAIDNI